MPKYFVSRYLAPEAATIYEDYEDGSYRSVTPQGHEHRATGQVPADLELDEREALRLLEQRAAYTREHEVERLPTFEKLLRFGPDELAWSGEEKDYERPC